MKCYSFHLISQTKSVFTKMRLCLKRVYSALAPQGRAAVAIYCDAGTILFIIDDKYVILANM